MPDVAEFAAKLGVTFFDWQLDAYEKWKAKTSERLLLYYRTGAGKSITALTCIALRGYTQALVVAPPSTHHDWVALGVKLGVSVTAVSHAKFRMRDFLLSKQVPVIADEFHLFGGQAGQGWKKLDRLAQHLQAPLILCSATPNYNDAERCYCVQHILAPKTCRGGYLEFIYQHCKTEQNPFGMMPIVTGFLRFSNAGDYLASLQNVVYLPDNVFATIVDVPLTVHIPDEFDTYGLNRKTGRIMASDMEARHQRTYLALVNDDGKFHEEIYERISTLAGMASGPVLLYCNSARVALALAASAEAHRANIACITGAMSSIYKHDLLEKFKRGELDVLIGTATLATGTDGLDKVCDTMIIVHDTNDPSLRRQLMGRILPRGEDADASNKQFYRLEF